MFVTYILLSSEHTTRPIAVVLDPQAPAGVRTHLASPGSTVVSLESVPGGTSYHIYGSEHGRGSLDLLGVTSSTSFDTGILWASQPAWLFAVSAVTKEGKEGALSDVVLNSPQDIARLSRELREWNGNKFSPSGSGTNCTSVFFRNMGGNPPG